MKEINVQIIKLCIGAISTIQELKYAANDTTEYEIICRLEQMINKMSKYEFVIKPLPIETAPKDGTVIDIWYKNERIPNVYWNEEHEMWRDDSGDYFDDATHWLPIPTIE